MEGRINLTPYRRLITREDYHRRNGHGPALLWFTGLSGSGKSTLAHLVGERLFERGLYTYVLDADDVRSGLNGDLGFTAAERRENIRRVGEVAHLFTEAGLVVLAALISPFREDRDRVRALFSSHEFFEIYVKCPLKVCESRDPKGLYRRARAGEIPDFTGISSPYEEPHHPEIVIDTSDLDITEAVGSIMQVITENLSHRRGRRGR